MDTPSSEQPAEVESPKDAVKALFLEFGGEKAVADRLGLGKTRVNNFTKEHLDDEISFARVCQLTGAGATAAAKYLARLAGGVFCAVPAGPAGDTLALTSREMRDNADAVASVIDGLRDGKLTKPEAEAALPLIDAAMCDLGAIRGALLKAADRA